VPVGVSVLICCYNSAQRLPETLRHLALQQVSENTSYEIIVIDNGSDDGTAVVARQEWDRQGIPTVDFKIFNEPKPGKNHALQTGINNSAYKYILICDDDNWLDPTYIEKACHIMQSDSKIGAAGGQGIAVADEKLPDWFQRYQHGYAVGVQSNKTGDVSAKKYLWGAGMVFRKSIYTNAYLNLPSFLSGPKENTLTRGEDVEFCMRILLSGYKLHYDEALIFKHYMPVGRLTVEYQQRLFSGYDYERHILNLYAIQVKIRNSSLISNSFLVFFSILRYIISKIYLKGRWDHTHEAQVIYLITGIKLTGISNEISKMRQLYLQLSINRQLPGD